MADHQHFVPARGTHGVRSGVPATSSKDEPEMYTAKDLQQILKIDVKTIYSYVKRGLIPYVKIQSNVRFPKQRILEWIEQQSYDPRLTQKNR